MMFCVTIDLKQLAKLLCIYKLPFGFRVLEGSIRAINPLASRAPATRRLRPGKPLAYCLSVTIIPV